MSVILSSAIIGTIFIFMGLFSLRFSWARSKPPIFYVLGGWAAIVLGLIAWANAAGNDRGTAIGILVFCIIALFFIGYSALTSGKFSVNEKKRKNMKETITGRRHWKIYFKQIGMFFLLVPISGIIALCTGFSFYELLEMSGTDASNSLVFMLFSFPLIWAVLAAYILISHNKWRKTTVLSILGLSSIVLMVMGN